MIDRRELMLAAGAAGAIAAPHAAWAQTLRAAPAVALYDGRYQAARRFAAALTGSGALALETDRDVAQLWYGRLQRIVTGYPGLRIAGLATEADFQVIRGCAAEARLTLAHHAVHDGRPGFAHRTLRGPDQDHLLAAAGSGWPEALASRLTGAAASPGRAGGTDPVTLVSWLIA
jgi:hypothetical protein